MFRACMEAFDCSVICHSEIYISAFVKASFYSNFNAIFPFQGCERVGYLYVSSASGSAT